MLSLYIQVSEEEDPAGHVVESSTITDEMSGDVNPAPPQITDQNSAVSHSWDWEGGNIMALYCLSSSVPLPQDEEYASQLQHKLYCAMSDEPVRGEVVKPVTERVSSVEI